MVEEKQKIIDKHTSNRKAIEKLECEQSQLEESFLKFSKFNVGDPVKYKGIGNGFVEGIRPKGDFESELGVYYRVKKMKKDGTISRHNICFYSISESDLTLITVKETTK